MARGRKPNATGRSTGAAPFVMLPHWAFDSEAYQSLKPGPCALLWALIRLHNGANNGRIAFSQRDMAAAINVTDRETVAGYVRELEARGFIKATRRGAFSVKVANRRATEWALTWIAIGDELPTKEFARWRPGENDGTEKPASKDGKAVPKAEADIRHRPNVRENPPRAARLRVIAGTG